MRLIWSKLAAWRLFFLGKDLVLHFKQFRFDGATFFNYIQHSKMQHFCSIFQLTRCIRESWLNVVFVVCSLGENLLIDLFFKYLKKQTLLIFWASRLVKMYSLTSFDKTGGFWNLKAQKVGKANFVHFVSAPFGGNPLIDFFWQIWWLLKALKF